MLEAVTMGDELLCERIEQLGVRRWVGRAHVVQRIDDSPAEEMGPVAIGDGPAEERVFRLGHPVNQLLPWIIAGCDLERRRVERLDLRRALRSLVRDGAARSDEE